MVISGFVAFGPGGRGNSFSIRINISISIRSGGNVGLEEKKRGKNLT